MQEEAISAFTGSVTERRRAGGATGNLGIFIEDDWQIGPMIINGGLRADRSSITGGFVAIHNIDARPQIQVSFTTGFLPTAAIRIISVSHISCPVVTTPFVPVSLQ